MPFIEKSLERVVCRELMRHMQSNDMFIPNQSSGYKQGHSVETLLLKITNGVLIAYDNNSARYY